MSTQMEDVKFHELHQENLLAIYDVMLDIRQESQLDPDHVTIRIFRNIIRFNELFPGDSIGMRDRYCEARWKALKFLERIGAVSDVRYIEGSHRWESMVEVDPGPARFFEIFNAVEAEYFRRTGAREERVTGASTANNVVAASNRNKIFVVHGRDLRLRDGIFAFLRSIGLEPIEWIEAVALTGKSSPYIGEILDAAFANAQAVVVMFTGDDEARLRPELRQAKEPAHETNLTPQARPNVLFEAGMAMAHNPDRTVLVEFGHLRPFSDIAGRHSVKMDGSTEKRQELAVRLQKAGCAVKLTGTDWHKAGDLGSSSPRT